MSQKRSFVVIDSGAFLSLAQKRVWRRLCYLRTCDDRHRGHVQVTFPRHWGVRGIWSRTCQVGLAETTMESCRKVGLHIRGDQFGLSVLQAGHRSVSVISC